jgi:outer membrane protein TolC
MAKRQSVAVEHKIEDFAVDLGKMLGHARNKAEGWLGQREQIVKNLTQLRDEANTLLSQLGHEAQGIVRRGRPPLARGVRKLRGMQSSVGLVVDKLRGTPPVRKRRKMSKAARARISAAQKARWAKVKAGGKK